MKRNKHRGYHGSSLSFIDMLWNLLLVFATLFVLALLQISAESSTPPAPEMKAEYLIQLDWDDYSKSDIDLWVRLPDDTIIGYKNQTCPWASLDRDDLGINDYYEVPGGAREEIPFRREIISIRKKVPGRYTVNTEFYRVNTTDIDKERATGKLPVHVRVQLIQVNPFKVIYTRDYTMEKAGDEITAFNFLEDEKGRIYDVSTSQVNLVTGPGEEGAAVN